jgi:hypothetical protein
MFRFGALVFMIGGFLMVFFWLYGSWQERSIRQQAEVLSAQVLGVEEIWSKNKKSRWGSVQAQHLRGLGDTLSWTGQCVYEYNCGQLPCPKIGDTLWLLRHEQRIWPRDVEACIRTDYLSLVLGLGWIILGGALWKIANLAGK